MAKKFGSVIRPRGASLANNVFLSQKINKKEAAVDPNRLVDRKEIYKAIFKGKPLRYDDMFNCRGFRGLNVLPFPKHVKE